jgi:hypothetical protein
MKNRTQVFLLLILLVSVLAGCSRTGLPATAEIQVTQPSASEVPIAYPSPVSSSPPETSSQSQEGTPYPAPTEYVYETATLPSYPVPRSGTSAFTPQTFDVPEPTADKGVVTGTMLDLNTGEPMRFVWIYLGKKIFLTPGPGYNYALQEKSSPHTQSDENGRFAIGDVPPGNYLLMIFTPRSASVVMVPNTDREQEVVVEAGETNDVGEVKALPPTY